MQNDRRPRSATPKNTPLTPKPHDGAVNSHRRKSRMLHIRVTPDEENRAIEAARLLSMRLGTWSRFAMMHVAGAPTREEYEALDVDGIINRLNRVGNNLNQLARAANRGGIAMNYADRLMLIDLQNDLAATRALFEAWREAVKTRTARLILPNETKRKRKT